MTFETRSRKLSPRQEDTINHAVEPVSSTGTAGKAADQHTYEQYQRYYYQECEQPEGGHGIDVF